MPNPLHQQTTEHTNQRTLLSRAFPNVIGLLRIIPRPAWAAPMLVVLGIFASLAEAAGILLIPLFFYSMMNQLNYLVSSGGPLGAALRFAVTRFHSSRQIALVFLLLIILRGVIAYAYGLATAHVGEQISQTTRDRVHSLYLRLPYRFLQQHDQAELVEALGREAWLPSTAYHSLTRIFVNATFIVMLGGLLVLLSWKITICVFLGSVLLAGALRLLSSRAYVIGAEVKRVHQSLWNHMMVTLQGMRTIRAFRQEAFHEQRFDDTSASARKVAIKTMQLTLLLDPLTEVGYLIILGVIVVCAPYFGVTFATTLTCVALLYRLQPHVREIEDHRLNLLQLEPQLQSVRSILDEGRYSLAPFGATPIDGIRHAIRFDHVTFQYQPDAPAALDNVSFQIPAGLTTALVGASGSGKTTVVNLLLGLYRPDAGAAYVDDTPLDELDRSDWLKLIAVAGQDVDLVEGSVLENIKMADLQASEEMITSAAALVGISEFMESLPQGYNTWIGQQGLRFSGGQRQRIGLARATLHNPKFLILDEAMSAMDLALEQKVRKSIQTHFQGCTVLLITHRLETVLNSDHVICIEEGRIVAEGEPSAMLQDSSSALSKALVQAH
ncbi:MAG: ABC transporter ATP-binding protein [Acidobacteriaceae bacterium]